MANRRLSDLLASIRAAFAGAAPGGGGDGGNDGAAPPQPVAGDGPPPSRPADSPYPVVTVSGDGAMAAWQRLRDEGTGWPVVVGSDQNLRDLLGSIGRRHDPDAILAAAARLSIADDLPAWDMGDAEAGFDIPDAATAAWPEGPMPQDDQPLSVAGDLLTRQPHARCHIIMLPTRNGWEVPAYLNIGGWNASPAPALHVAVLRDWHRRYGAELIGLQVDTMNIRVARRPSARAEALALAVEQVRYCSDVIEEDEAMLLELAQGLLAQDWWHFWWD